MMRTIILKTAVSIVVPLSLIFAMFIYFKGHQTPGGGFVAGLVAAVALILHRMSMGRESLNRLLPFSERILIAIGLTMAVATGMIALFFGLPFMTSNHGHDPLPGGYEWASVMLFDLGVFFVVTGVVVGMISALSNQLDHNQS